MQKFFWFRNAICFDLRIKATKIEPQTFSLAKIGRISIGDANSIQGTVGGSRRRRSVSTWFVHFPFLSRGSHYCGGQSRAGASTVSHTPGRTNRKIQWHVTFLLAVLSQRWMHHDECTPTTTKAWIQTNDSRRRQLHEWNQTTVTSSSK